MRLSERATLIEPQLARVLYMKAKKYRNVIDLTLGDPDMPTPENVKKAGCEAIRANQTHYTANRGTVALRQAVAEDISKRLGVDYDPETELIITPGAMGALYLSSMCLLNPGDEAILLAPHWPNYTNMVKMCSAVAIDCDCLSPASAREALKNIYDAVTPKTRLIAVNSPCNPTGRVLSPELLDGVAELAVKNDIYVLSDEVYSSIIFDSAKHDSILSRPGMRERTVLIDSLSKRFSMTGWRVGFAAAPGELTGKMAELQEHTSSCVSPFTQQAAVEALKNAGAGEREIRESFARRCRFMADLLGRIPLLGCVRPRATFYIFVDIKKTGLNSLDFATRLLESEQVAVVPGAAFGRFGEGYIRIACSAGEETLAVACDRIAKFVKNIN